MNMSEDIPRYVCRHISLSNPRGAGQDDLALLLRRSADLIDEGLSKAEILDFVVGSEINDYGTWWSITVYFEQ